MLLLKNEFVVDFFKRGNQTTDKKVVLFNLHEEAACCCPAVPAGLGGGLLVACSGHAQVGTAVPWLRACLPGCSWSQRSDPGGHAELKSFYFRRPLPVPHLSFWDRSGILVQEVEPDNHGGKTQEIKGSVRSGAPHTGQTSVSVLRRKGYLNCMCVRAKLGTLGSSLRRISPKGVAFPLQFSRHWLIFTCAQGMAGSLQKLLTQ